MSSFDATMRMMRRNNPQTQEAGFRLLLARAGDHIDALLGEFATEQDPGLRCRLLELIGAAESPKALPDLLAQLDSPDEALRRWAARGLSGLGTREARTALWRARANSSGHRP
ncbi:HEAT repeat domain-containing protein [Amycolatopsis sp. FDAARGOS 1241]|uniref:HEAT repeat domain-containing protein n=1 Tax=Amycolatopsis sp. FDAARGOS 1241 TaxID=2778070 RepID=UPI0019521F70|nr:HEAT repeat domain-containing protein [Amycolatopsis sp. FDAARGOS 1241]QRP47512.1 HEAT repeat domain-containing protein [Amycolatopsis sp. FDAARGOS 1241]